MMAYSLKPVRTMYQSYHKIPVYLRLFSYHFSKSQKAGKTNIPKGSQNTQDKVEQ